MKQNIFNRLQYTAAVILMTMPLTASLAEPTLQELIEQGHRAADNYQFPTANEPKNEAKQKIHFKEMDGKNIQVLPQGQLPENPNKKIADKATTVIFISMAMPQQEISKLFNQAAGNKDILFVLRGWVGGEAKNTRPFIKKEQNRLGKKMPTVMLYPQVFKTYQVGKVPAILHKNKDGNWYMAQGGLDINYAISAIERHQYKMPLSRQWEVIEPDQLAYSKKKTQEKLLKKAPELEKRRVAAIKKIYDGKIELPWATETKTDTFTPYYTLLSDIINPKTYKAVYKKGTKINLLGEDTEGKRALLFIDGRDEWQVNFAKEIHQKRPDAYIFYTQRGSLKDISAYPLDSTMTDRLQIKVVPTLLIQKNNRFERRTYKRR
ncbi:MAG: hypothetical protein IJ143_07450 [Neisseriaceae bacterium]|nr:hypothetical protein [Neisseriaceae bacterium]